MSIWTGDTVKERRISMRRSQSLGGYRAVADDGTLARSLGILFCSEAAFNLQLTRRLIRRAGAGGGVGAGGGRETLLLSRYAKWVAFVRPLPRWDGARDVSHRLPVRVSTSVLHIYMGAKSTRPLARSLASLPPRGRISLSLPIVDAVENEICPSFPPFLPPSFYPSRRDAS